MAEGKEEVKGETKAKTKTKEKKAISLDFSGLNAAQREAVMAPPGHQLILAGAGTGKTRVLTMRLAALVAAGTPLTSLMAVTFTNKAAQELRERVKVTLSEEASNLFSSLWVGTFHGICHRMLRAYAKEAGLPAHYRILDAKEALALITELLEGESEEGEENSNGVSQRELSQMDDYEGLLAIKPSDVLTFINRHKEEGVRAKDAPLPLEKWSSKPVPASVLERYVSLYKAYEARTEEMAVVDFAELILRVVELFETHPKILKAYQRRFAHILVDEFQDINAMQYRWLTLLCGAGKADSAKTQTKAKPKTKAPALFAVGDDDQSIYAFRGAKVELLSAMLTDFAEDRATPIAPIRLEENYRSSATILAAANAVIAHNKERLGKTLRVAEARPPSRSAAIRLVMKEDSRAEADWVAHDVEAQLENGVPAEEIAILYRVNALSSPFEMAFRRRHIPLLVNGGPLYFQRAEIKTLLSYLALLLEDPHDMDVLRVANAPERAVSEEAIESLKAFAKREGVTLWEALGGQDYSESPYADEMLLSMRALLKAIRYEARKLPLPDVVALTILGSGLADYYKDIGREEALMTLNALTDFAESFVEKEGLSLTDSAFEGNEDTASSLATFMDYVALVSEDQREATKLAKTLAKRGSVKKAQEENPLKAVQLMSVHAAKGLEFKVVYIVGAEYGLFPHYGALHDPKCGGLEEERRLMYVAMTRAKEKLSLAMSAYRAEMSAYPRRSASPFLGEIPAELLEAEDY